MLSQALFNAAAVAYTAFDPVFGMPPETVQVEDSRVTQCRTHHCNI